MDGLIVFARLCQCLPQPIHAYLGPSESRNPKSISYRFSHFCTAHSRVLFGMLEHVLSPKNCPLTWGDLDPIQYMVPWDHPSLHPKWHLNRFSCFFTAQDRVSLYFTMGRSFPLQIAHFHEGIWTPTTLS